MIGSRLRLPTELDRWVLDLLWNDSESLRQCSIVCKAWLHPARKLLFHTIALHTRCNFDAFIRVLRDDSTLSQHVRKLGIICRPGPSEARSSSLLSADTAWVADALRELGSKKLQLDELVLRGSADRADITLDHFTCTALVQDFGALKRLSLSEVTFHSTQTLSAMLSSLPLLTNLEIGSVWFDRTGPSLRLMDTSRISNLSLMDLSPHPMLALIANDSVLMGVPNLSLCEPHGIEHKYMLSAILKACGSSLRRVSLDCQLREASRVPFDFSHNTELQHVILRSCQPWKTPMVAEKASHKLPPHLILGLSDSPVRELTVIIYYNGSDPGRDISWKSISDMMLDSTSTFTRNLRRVHIAFVTTTEWLRYLRRSDGTTVTAEHRKILKKKLEEEGRRLATDSQRQLQHLVDDGILRVYTAVSSTLDNNVTWLLRDQYLQEAANGKHPRKKMACIAR